jgi:hypothetical protein
MCQHHQLRNDLPRSECRNPQVRSRYKSYLPYNKYTFGGMHQYKHGHISPIQKHFVASKNGLSLDWSNGKRDANLYGKVLLSRTRQRTLILLQGGNCRAVARIPVCTRTLSPLFLVAFFSTFSIIWFRGEGPQVEALGQDWAGDGHPPSRHLDDCGNLLELLPNLHDLRT